MKNTIKTGLKYGALTAGMILCLSTLSGCGFTHKTANTEVGVRVKKLSSGVQQRTYAPGRTFFFAPIVNDWYTLSIKNHTLDMTLIEQDNIYSSGGNNGALPTKTHDGNDIWLAMTINWQVMPEKAPHIVQYVAENDKDLEQVILRYCRSAPRNVFGELKTEEFYDSQKRADKNTEIETYLNSVLNPEGIVITNVSLRDYKFTKDYQAIIDSKRVQEQNVYKNKAEADKTVELYKAAVQNAIGTKDSTIAYTDGEATKIKIQADATYEAKKDTADAIYFQYQAEAGGIVKLAEALRGAGGNKQVAMELYKALQESNIQFIGVTGGGKEGSIDIKKTDMNKLLEYLIGTQTEEAAPVEHPEGK